MATFKLDYSYIQWQNNNAFIFCSLDTQNETMRPLLAFMHFHCKYGIHECYRAAAILIITAVTVISSQGAPRAQDNTERLHFQNIRATITRISRDSLDGLIRISTDSGTFFTRPSIRLGVKSGSGTILLRSEDCESFLLANVNKPCRLTVCEEVDGLVTAVSVEGGPSLDMSVSFQAN